MKIKMLVAMLLLSPLVFGQAVKTFTWTPPTQYESVDGNPGAPLFDSEITQYSIYCNNELLATVPNTGGTDTYVSGWLAPGTYDCTATAWANGLESERSNSTNFTVDPLRPEAPSGFSVTFP